MCDYVAIDVNVKLLGASGFYDYFGNTCNLATCNLYPATCNLPPATCPLQPATCNLYPAPLPHLKLLGRDRPTALITKRVQIYTRSQITYVKV